MFRFTIRDLLWLTVVVALVGGWLVDHRKATLAYQDQKKLATYRAALIEMRRYFEKRIGEPLHVQVLDDVLVEQSWPTEGN